jgi:tetratricopeptide (TPR) repeat protein
MAKDDWFRRTTWTPEDRERFYGFFEQVPSEAFKAQYARVQAYHLYEGGTEEGLRGALELLDIVFERYPDEGQIGPAYSQKGDCLRLLGDMEGALKAWRAAIDAERANPHIRTSAYLDLAWAAATLPIPEDYDAALGLLEEFGNEEGFPVQVYKNAGARALILAARGKAEEAKPWAEKALAAAGKRNPVFQDHPTKGLVGESERAHQEKLARLAAGEP